MRQILIPVMFAAAAAAVAACGPTTPATPGASASASMAPAASTAPGSAPTTGPATGPSSGPVGPVDLSAFPLSGTGKRRLLYSWTEIDSKGTETGTDEMFDITACDSSCTAYVTRINGTKTERQRDRAYPSYRQGVLIPSFPTFSDQTVDLEAKLKEGGSWPEETVTVKAGTFKAQKLTYGGTRSFTFWIAKPYVVKAEYKNTDTTASIELQALN